MLARLNPRLGHEEIGLLDISSSLTVPKTAEKRYKVPSVDALFVRRIVLYFDSILDQGPNVLNHSAIRTR
jgi:hypothetical protein